MKIRTLLSLFTGLLLTATSVAQTNSTAFNYIGSFNTQGVPLYLEKPNDVIDQVLLNDIKTSLPEATSVLTTHPEFIAATTQTDLILKAETDVWVTFVHENAGYTNALGYYTYDPANPPKTSTAIAKRIIIFPNVSYANSGGGLTSGNKVKIGTFPANTGIGWFVVADAFKNGTVTTGNAIFYSQPNLNPETNAAVRSHNVLLKDAANKRFILGFDDQRRDMNSDNDFNDVLFYITASSFDAIKTDDVAVIIKSPDTAANNGNTNIGSNTGGSASSSSTTNTNTNNAGTSNTVNGSGPVTIINNTTIVNNNGNGNSTGVGNNSNTGSGNNTGNTNAGSNTNSGGSNNGINPQNSGSTNPGNGQTSGGTASGCISCISNVTTCDVNMTVCNRSGISKVDFDKIKNTINKQAVLSSKMTVLKQSVTNKKVTVMQVVQLVKLFSVEHYRLEAAEYLFPYTCDKSNFYQVNDVLLTSSVQQLNAFLKGKDMSDDGVTKVNSNVKTADCNALPHNEPTPNGNSNAYGNTGSCSGRPFSSDQFFDLKNEINAQSFSDTRFTVMQQGIEGRCLTANQSAELISMCSFETDKLKVAKLLYAYTGDKENYYKVNKQFSFSSTVDELNKYIQTQK